MRHRRGTLGGPLKVHRGRREHQVVKFVERQGDSADRVIQAHRGPRWMHQKSQVHWLCGRHKKSHAAASPGTNDRQILSRALQLFRRQRYLFAQMNFALQRNTWTDQVERGRAAALVAIEAGLPATGAEGARRSASCA